MLAWCKEGTVSQVGNETRVPENPGNPPIFKPVNPSLWVVKNPGFTGLVLAIIGVQLPTSNFQFQIFNAVSLTDDNQPKSSSHHLTSDPIEAAAVA